MREDLECECVAAERKYAVAKVMALKPKTMAP
jgi:hypothetical protein